VGGPKETDSSHDRLELPVDLRESRKSYLNQTSLKATAKPQRGEGRRHWPARASGLTELVLHPPPPPHVLRASVAQRMGTGCVTTVTGAAGRDRRPAASHSRHRSRVRRHRARRCHHDHGCRPCFPPCVWSVGISISSHSAAAKPDNGPAARASRVRRHIISSRVLEPARSCICRRGGLTPMR
jgi:hypothetical protein